jgi:hypothetical protein
MKFKPAPEELKANTYDSGSPRSASDISAGDFGTIFSSSLEKFVLVGSPKQLLPSFDLPNLYVAIPV